MKTKEHVFKPFEPNIEKCECGCMKRVKKGEVRYNKSGSKFWLKVTPKCKSQNKRVHPYMVESNWMGRVFKPTMNFKNKEI